MYRYLGEDNEMFKVEDTDDGAIDVLSGDELRVGLKEVGEIAGISFNDKGDIIDEDGVVIVEAIHTFAYRGETDEGAFKVEDVYAGTISVLTGDELRAKLLQVGKIDGVELDAEGNICNEWGVILVKAPPMPGRNSNLSKAKKAKNDEFYTQLSDIEAELSKYPVSAFKDKVIYCPMDVAVNTGKTMQSQFVKYFQMNAHRLQFKKLICTCLVERAAGEGESLDEVQNCYVLERVTVPVDQRYTYGFIHSGRRENMVIGQHEDESGRVMYDTQDGMSHKVPFHIINQAVTEAQGRYVLVRRFFDGFSETDGSMKVSEVDTGKTWYFDGHTLKFMWCRKSADGVVTPLPKECYFFNNGDFLSDFSIFPQDENGNPCFESVDGGSVCLYPSEYYDYREVEYKEQDEYAEYFSHCPVVVEEKTKDGPMQSGDFRSEYCRKILAECDIVVTNPPFSLFREFWGLLMGYEKKFLIIGNINAVTYKEVFPAIRENKAWWGITTNGSNRYMEVPDDYQLTEKTCKVENGHRYAFVNGIMWYTNIDTQHRHESMTLFSREDWEAKGVVYYKYDNYDAIDVSKVAQIPADYEGVMGVPITFLNKYCPEQFEIVAFRKGDDGKDLVFSREREQLFNRTFGYLFDGVDGSNYGSSLDDVFRRKEQICQDSDSPEDMKFFADYICRHLDLAEQAVLKREQSKCYARMPQTCRTGLSTTVRSEASIRMSECLSGGAQSDVPEQYQPFRGSQECRGQDSWKDYLRKSSYSLCDVIEQFMPLSIQGRAAGTMNGYIDGKETYRRILIRHV